MSEEKNDVQQAQENQPCAETAFQSEKENAEKKEAPGGKQNDHKNKPSLSDRLYKQIEIMEREQEKIESGYGGSINPRAARSENLAFAKQITETANTIINIKRGGKQI